MTVNMGSGGQGISFGRQKQREGNRLDMVMMKSEKDRVGALKLPFSWGQKTPQIGLPLG